MAKKKTSCKTGFPTFAIILLVLGILWLLSELNIILVEVPWIPIILIIVAIGLIFNRVIKKSE
jgi:hypothetical protein